MMGSLGAFCSAPSGGHKTPTGSIYAAGNGRRRVGTRTSAQHDEPQLLPNRKKVDEGNSISTGTPYPVRGGPRRSGTVHGVDRRDRA